MQTNTQAQELEDLLIPVGYRTVIIADYDPETDQAGDTHTHEIYDDYQ
jgi:hypothetical protein